MMPWRLSRSHLNCLFVMCKNLPNLQPAVAAWQSLVYCADIVSWVIIFLKPFFCILFCPSRKYAQAWCCFSQAPLRSPRPCLSCSDGNAARVVFTILFLSPGSPHSAVVDATGHSARSLPPHPAAMGFVEWSGIQDHKRTEVLLLG